VCSYRRPIMTFEPNPSRPSLHKNSAPIRPSRSSSSSSSLLTRASQHPPPTSRILLQTSSPSTSHHHHLPTYLPTYLPTCTTCRDKHCSASPRARQSQHQTAGPLHPPPHSDLLLRPRCFRLTACLFVESHRALLPISSPISLLPLNPYPSR
jgi:hypothetical protein